MLMKTYAAALATAAVLTVPAVASAHVTVQPPEAPARGYAVISVRVPNEKDDQGTTKVAVQFPAGVASASYQAAPGWKVRVTRRAAATPIDVHGEAVNEEIDTVTFTGDGKQGRIGPGQFRDFPLSIRVPDGKEGDTLTFKANQTYEGGEVVRWIGAADADFPAPQLTLDDADDDHHGAPGADDATTDDAGDAAASTDSGAGELTRENRVRASSVAADDEDDDSGNALAIGLGAAGLVAGLAGLGVALVSRRRPSA